MASMKKIMIMGNVGREPESRFSSDGNEFVSFTVAVNERPRRQQGADQAAGSNPEELTTWFRVTAFRHRAEFAKQYVQKGAGVFVMGNFSAREYVGNDGQKRTTLEVVADEIQLMSSRGGVDTGGAGFDEGASFGGAAPARPSASYGNRPAAGPSGGRPTPAPAFEEDEGDMPF